MDEDLLSESIEWEETGGGEFPYRATVGDAALEIRIGDFPEELYYALLIDGVVVAEFDDWPVAWKR